MKGRVEDFVDGLLGRQVERQRERLLLRLAIFEADADRFPVPRECADPWGHD